MPHTEDELLRASGCFEADDSATIPSDIASRQSHIQDWSMNAIAKAAGHVPSLTCECSCIGGIHADHCPVKLTDAITMHAQELADLSEECGRTLTVLEATTYRIRRLKERLIDELLKGAKP